MFPGRGAAESGLAASAAPRGELHGSPAGARKTLRFESRHAGAVVVKVHDLGGRVVSTRTAHRISGTSFEVGLVDEAATLAPGVYFYRAEIPEGALRGRFVVLR